MDANKRKIYQRIMTEAKQKTEHEREKENKKRKKMGKLSKQFFQCKFFPSNFQILKMIGQPPLPEDTFKIQYKANCDLLFDEIEEKRNHYIRLEQGARRRRQEEIELLTLKQQYKILTEEEWVKSREERITK